MTTETEYQNAVNYLTKLLNGGLMGGARQQTFAYSHRGL